MCNRREKRKNNKKKVLENEIPCIIFLSTDEHESFDLAEAKENRQLRYISEYADAHGLVPVRIIRRSCMGQRVCNELFKRCIRYMQVGRPKAILVASMSLISSGEADAYHKIGMVRENGFRIFSVDDKGELELGLTGFGGHTDER